VPAARKALEPVVQRQTGSVAAQPELPTALVTQAICDGRVSWGDQARKAKEHTPHWGTPAVRSTAVEAEAAAEVVDEAAMAVAAKMAREV